jgi:hypothetical protein
MSFKRKVQRNKMKQDKKFFKQMEKMCKEHGFKLGFCEENGPYIIEDDSDYNIMSTSYCKEHGVYDANNLCACYHKGGQFDGMPYQGYEF